jgi:hypothetical protein
MALVSADAHLHTHGGLTPAARDCAFDSRWTMFDSRGTAIGSPNHGGLTRDSLVSVRVCTANGVIFPETGVVHPGAAGVSQPWRTIGSCVVNVITPRKPIANAGAVHRTTAG